MKFYKKTKWYLPVLIIVMLILLIVSLIMVNLNSGESEEEKTSEEDTETSLDTLVFPKDEVVDVRITIDEDDFQDMLDNASSEEMKQADVEYNGIKMENVGIRTKGNSSLDSVVRSDSDRYSFKLSFDEYISSQKLYGISKINLNNNYNDPTYMREYLTYELASEMGLPVPKYSYVNIYINDELWGFYLAVEQIGTSYLERNFGDAYGSLYKAEMANGTDLVWNGDDRDSYAGLIQKSEHADDDALLAMIDELNNGSDYESVLDVENVLKYMALNVATYNMDSYIGRNMHNYYLYEQNGIFSVLPWDFNLSFDGMPNGGGRPDDLGADNQNGDAALENGQDNPNMNGENANQVMENVPPMQGELPAQGENDAALNGARQMETEDMSQLNIDAPAQTGSRPLIDNLLQNEEYKEMYHLYLQEAIDNYLQTDIFASKVATLKEQISSYVEQDPRPFFTYEQFEEGIDELLATNESNITNIMQQLNGEKSFSDSQDVTNTSNSEEQTTDNAIEQQNGNNQEGIPVDAPLQQGMNNQQAADNQQIQQGANARQGQQIQQGANAQQGEQLQQGVANQQGQRQLQQGMNDQQGGMPPFANNREGIAQNGTTVQGNKVEVIISAVLLLVLGLVALFIANYKKHRI